LIVFVSASVGLVPQEAFDLCGSGTATLDKIKRIMTYIVKDAEGEHFKDDASPERHRNFLQQVY
jgi:hypothetical protein